MFLVLNYATVWTSLALTPLPKTDAVNEPCGMIVGGAILLLFGFIVT